MPISLMKKNSTNDYPNKVSAPEKIYISHVRQVLTRLFGAVRGIKSPPSEVVTNYTDDE